MDNNSLRIIFMGTPEFAVPTLDILLNNNYNIVGVVTSTDKYGGRGKKKLIESAVKKFAQKKALKILQPKNLKAAEFVNELRSLRADLQIVVAFRMLPEVVWNMPPLGTYNLHGSLLPKYRGAAPINWAIINGEKETGVTSFKLKHEIDTGDMVLQKKLDIMNSDTAGDLHDRMKWVAAETILETVKIIESGNVKFIKQNSEKVTKAPKINNETCEINFNDESRKVYNFIRGLSPYPGAWTKIDGKFLKIYSATFDIEHNNNIPGQLITDFKSVYKIATKDGFIVAEEVQVEGKRKMKIKEYLNGLKKQSNHTI